MEKYVLEKDSLFNYFVFNDRPLTNITFYNKEGEICSLGKGWFGDNNKLNKLVVPLIKVKRKKDFNHKGCFVLPSTTIYGSKGYALYIEVDNENVKLTSSKSEKDMGTDTYLYTHYQTVILGESIWFNLCDKVKRTELGNEIDKWKEIFNEQGISIDYCSLEMLIRNFNITEK